MRFVWIWVCSGSGRLGLRQSWIGIIYPGVASNYTHTVTVDIRYVLGCQEIRFKWNIFDEQKLKPCFYQNPTVPAPTLVSFAWSEETLYWPIRFKRHQMLLFYFEKKYYKTIFSQVEIIWLFYELIFHSEIDKTNKFILLLATAALKIILVAKTAIKMVIISSCSSKEVYKCVYWRLITLKLKFLK